MLTHSKTFSGFSTDKIETVKDFYSKTLGLKTEDNAMGILELHFDSGQKVIIYPKPNHTPATFTVLNFMVQNIEETVTELTNAGVTFERYDGEIKTDEKGIVRGGGPLIAWFKDPAGNILSVIEQK